MLVYLRDGSAQMILCAATLRQKLQIKLTQSQYTDTGLTSPSADPRTPGAWQGSHWSANFWVTGMTRPWKKSRRKRELNPESSALKANALPLGQWGGWWWKSRTAMMGRNVMSTILIHQMMLTKLRVVSNFRERANWNMQLLNFWSVALPRHWPVSYGWSIRLESNT